MQPKIAVVYLSFHCEPYMPMVLPAMENITYPKDRIEFVIVDNPHPEHGSSVAFLQREVLSKSEQTLPKVTILANETNLGFAAGNNVGVRYAIEHGFDYVFFLNNDAYPEPDAFERLIEVFLQNPDVGIAQSLLLLHDDPHAINSSGNAVHFLGFGYSNDYKQDSREQHYPLVQDIGYASGAAFMIPVPLLRQIGGWHDGFFLYHEDMEFSFRARMITNKRVVLASASRVHHDYNFSRSITKYYWMERNRFVVWLMYMKWRTLLVLFPAWLLMEFAHLIFSVLRGWYKEKWRVYWYWLQPHHWRYWLGERKKVQKTRQISDTELMKYFVGKILFQEDDVESPLLKYIGNPIFNTYWRIVRLLIIW